MEYTDYIARADEYKRAAEDILARAKAEGRELDAVENASFEQLRGKIEEAQKTANELRDAEITRLQGLVAPQPETKDKGGVRELLRSMHIGEERTLLVGSGGGSYLVPQEWHNSVEAYRFQRNFLRQTGAMVVRTESTHNIPVLTANGAAAIVSENAEYTAVDPTVSQVILYAYKLTQKVPVSEELLADSAYDVAALTARSVGIGFAAAEEKYFLVGTGSSQPTGIFNKTADKTTATQAVITKDELIESVYGLARHYRDGAVWMMNDATALAIAKFKLDVTTSGTTPYFWTDAVGGEPPKLLGYPVYTNSNIATYAAGNKAICFGNPSMYVIGERGPMATKRLQLNEYSDTFAFNHRIDGKPLDPAAFYVVALHS
jgi:HK97 family phage major capsid protein